MGGTACHGRPLWAGARLGYPRVMRMSSFILRRGRLAWPCLLLGLVGCQSLPHMAHVSRGHLAVVRAAVPVEQAIATAEPAVAARLAVAVDARRFAIERVGLPRNRSYTRYAALGRDYVAWNVFATPEFSLEPVQHCFPFAGCVAYRGWFDTVRAHADAARMQARGLQVHVGGVAAYSTLGWFADPLLDVMLRWEEDVLVGLVFHELAHARLYVRGDTAFNEAYASFVEQQAMCEWRHARGRPEPDPARQAWSREVLSRLLDLRDALAGIYASGGDATDMRVARDAAIASHREWQREAWVRAGVAGDDPWRSWIEAPINNARLVPLGLYDAGVPAFAALFEDTGRDWNAFHAQAGLKARLPAAQRRAWLEGHGEVTVPRCADG